MKKVFSILTLAFYMSTTAAAPALASDGWVVMDGNGNVVSQSSGNSTDVNVAGGQTYQVLNSGIGAGQQLNINVLNDLGQADAAAHAIFNIADGQASIWDGVLNLVGTAAFVNPFGFVISESFQGNISGGAILSTLGINEGQFMAGVAELAREMGKDPAAILNQGTFNVDSGSFLALVGGAVRNEGTIAAEGGAAVLTAGDNVTLDISGGKGLIAVTVEEPVSAPVYDAAGNKISDAIANTGTIQANGGVAILTARAAENVFDNIINHTGVIEANSIREVNGRIVLDGGAQGIVRVNGDVIAAGDNPGETGGTIEIRGEKAGLFDNAFVDAAGYAGGGSINAGAGSKAVYVSSGAVLRADAVMEGNGGTILINSNESTKVHGTLSAKGGIISGDGGVIDTSGKQFLDITGARVDASASNGKGGAWLLDPHDTDLDFVDTTGGSFDGGSPNIFTPTADTSIVNIANVQDSLNNGTSVTITTGSTGVQAGNVRILNSITKSAGGDAEFRIEAAGTIEQTAAGIILSTAGALGIVFIAGASIILRNAITTNGGNVNLQAADGITFAEAEADVVTAGGSFTADANTDLDLDGQFFTNGAAAITGGAAVNTEGGTGLITISGTRLELGGALKAGSAGMLITATNSFIHAGNLLTSEGGNITAQATAAMTLDSEFSDVRSNGGKVTLTADSDGLDGGDFQQLHAGSSIQTGAGELQISGDKVDLDGVLGSTTGKIGVEARGGNLAISNNILTAGGEVSLKAANGILLDADLSDIRTQGGAVNADADSDLNNTGDFVQSHTGSVINAAAGALNLSGKRVDLDGTLRSTTGNISLQSRGGNMVISNSILTTGGGVDLKAASGILLDDVNSDITTAGGTVTADADSDLNNSGDFTQTGTGSVINASAGNIDLQGKRVDLDGTLRTTTGNINLVSRGGDMIISNVIQTTGGNVDLKAANGIALDNLNSDITTAGGKFTADADSDLNSAGDFTQTAAGSTVNTSAGDLKITGKDIDVDGTLRSTTGKIELTASGDVRTGNLIETTGGEVALKAGRHVQLDGPTTNITTGSGTVNITADTNQDLTGDFSQATAGAQINSKGGAVNIQAQNVNLTDALMDTDGGKLDIKAVNNVFVSGATDLRTDGGELALTGDSDGNLAGTIFQNGLTSILQSAGGPLNLTAHRLDLDGFVQSTTGLITLTATGGFILISNKISTGGGNVALNAANGITLDHADADITTSGGSVTANANTNNDNSGSFVQQDAGSTINTAGLLSSGNVNLSGRDLTQNGVIKSGTGSVNLTATRGAAVLGGEIETQGGAVEILAENGIQLGTSQTRTNGGAFTANANSNADDDGDLTQLGAAGLISTGAGAQLLTGRTATLEGTLRSSTGGVTLISTFGALGVPASILTQGGSVLLQAAEGINQGGAVIRTEGGSLTAEANTDGDETGDFLQTGSTGLVNTGNGAVSITGRKIDLDGTYDAGSFDATATFGFLRSSNAITTTGGNVNLTAANGVILDAASADIRTGGGQVAIQTDTNADGEGTYNQSNGGSLIETLGGNISINANNFFMGGTHNAGAGTVTITPTLAGKTIVLGDGVDSTGDVNISDGEVSRITASQLTIGSLVSSDITVGDFSPETVNTLLLLTGGSIREIVPGDGLADLTVTNLALHAGTGIDLDVDVTNIVAQNDGAGGVNLLDAFGGMTVTDVAGLSGVSTGSGDILLQTLSPLTINSGVTANGGGNITLAALGSLATDDLTLNANVSALGGSGNIQLIAGDTVTINGGVKVHAANTGAVTVAAGENFSDGALDQDGFLGSEGGDVIMAPDAVIETDEGDILVDAADDLLIGVLNADADKDGIAGDVTTLTRAGGVTDTNGKDLNIVANVLTMVSFLNIGSKADPIEAQYKSLAKQSEFKPCVGQGCNVQRFIAKVKAPKVKTKK